MDRNPKLIGEDERIKLTLLLRGVHDGGQITVGWLHQRLPPAGRTVVYITIRSALSDSPSLRRDRSIWAPVLLGWIDIPLLLTVCWLKQ